MKHQKQSWKNKNEQEAVTGTQAADRSSSPLPRTSHPRHRWHYERDNSLCWGLSCALWGVQKHPQPPPTRRPVAPSPLAADNWTCLQTLPRILQGKRTLGGCHTGVCIRITWRTQKPRRLGLLPRGSDVIGLGRVWQFAFSVSSQLQLLVWVPHSESLWLVRLCSQINMSSPRKWR